MHPIPISAISLTTRDSTGALFGAPDDQAVRRRGEFALHVFKRSRDICSCKHITIEATSATELQSSQKILVISSDVCSSPSLALLNCIRSNISPMLKWSEPWCQGKMPTSCMHSVILGCSGQPGKRREFSSHDLFIVCNHQERQRRALTGIRLHCGSHSLG